MTDRRRRALVAAAITLALAVVTAVRIHVVSGLRPAGWLLTYVHLADRILAGHTPYDQLGDFSPVYLWLMVAMRSIGLEPLSISALQVVALSLSALFCGVTAKRLAGWPAAIGAAGLLLGNRAAFVLATELDPKTLILFLTSAAFALLPPRTVDSPSRRDHACVAGAGLLLGISAVTHPYGYLVLLVVAVAWRRAALLTALIPIAFIPLASLVAIAPKTTAHSSSQFYEGNNALATGAAGVAPRVVADLQASLSELSADPVYRMLDVDWQAKAIATIRQYPRAALGRFAWKALLTVHNFNVYDVVTTKEKSLRLMRVPSVPFGAALALAIAALVLARSRRELVPFALVGAVLMVLLTLFVVSARQRNVLLVPLSILGGAGVAEIVTLARRRSERALLAFGGVLIVTALLGIEGAPMREYGYGWNPRGDPEAPEALFDRSRALENRGRWLEAEAILRTIADYRPLRGNHAVSSVAYHRARAALHLSAPAAVVRDLLEQAALEAPGDPHVLALRAVTIDPAEARVLDTLHDPFTRDFALAVALSDTGQRGRALALLQSLATRVPQWRRPRMLASAIAASVGPGRSMPAAGSSAH